MDTFPTEDIHKVQTLQKWVHNHQNLGTKVAIVFVNGILNNEARPPVLLNVLRDYFKPDVFTWERNTFMSHEFVSGLMTQIVDYTNHPKAGWVAGLVGMGLVTDAYFNAGRATNALLGYIGDNLQHLPSMTRFAARQAAFKYWGPDGPYTASVTQRIDVELPNHAFLFVGHSFGALSLATTRPYIRNEKGIAMLLLGSPEDHSKMMSESDQINPVFSVTHESDIIRMLHNINPDVETFQATMRSLEAHSQDTYSRLFN
jgi:hypothetical protein